MNQRHADGETLLLASREVARELPGFLEQVHPFQHLVDRKRAIVEGSEQPQHLEGGTLSDRLLDFRENCLRRGGVGAHQTAGAQPTLLLSFLDLLFQIAAADGRFHPAEETALGRIKEIFNISDKQFEDIKAVYFKDFDKNYKILNCTPDSSNEEIKSNYKKLVKEFHPDTIISKGLPEEFIEFASKRFQEIHGSYEKIRQERNF